MKTRKYELVEDAHNLMIKSDFEEGDILAVIGLLECIKTDNKDVKKYSVERLITESKKISSLNKIGII